MSIETTSAFISAIGAAASGVFALWSFFNERKVRSELKADEKLLVGKPHHPPKIDLIEHREAVLQIPVYNVSTTKRAFITHVQAFSENGSEEDITWSSKISDIGNHENAGNVVKVSSSADIFIRRTDGEGIDSLIVKIFHTFSKFALVVSYNSYEDLK